MVLQLGRIKCSRSITRLILRGCNIRSSIQIVATLFSAVVHCDSSIGNTRVGGWNAELDELSRVEICLCVSITSGLHAEDALSCMTSWRSWHIKSFGKSTELKKPSMHGNQCHQIVNENLLRWTVSHRLFSTHLSHIWTQTIACPLLLSSPSTSSANM